MDRTEKARIMEDLRKEAPGIAQKWMDGAFQGSIQEGERQKLLSNLTELVDRVVRIIYAGPFDPQKAREIGSSASALSSRASDFLGRSLDIITFELTRKLPPHLLHPLFPDITSFMANFSDGYHEAVRASILKDQSRACEAIMNDLMEADKMLRGTNEHLEAVVKERTSQLMSLNESLRSEIRTRMETEERLRKRENLLSAAFDTTLIWMALLDPDGRMLLLNQQAVDFTGLDRDELTGGMFWEASWWENDPSLKDRIEETIKRARMGEYLHFDVEHFLLRERTRDIELSVRPVKNENGEVLYIIVEGIDITWRKDTERKLKTARDELREFLENTSDILFSYDRDGYITFFSRPVRDIGLDVDNIIGQNVDQLIDRLHPLDQDMARGSLRKRIEELDDTPRIYRYLDRKKRVRWIEEEVRIVYGEDGKPVSINGVLRDITTRKEVEEELMKLNEVMKLINRIMRHDIKNRLAVVYGLLGLLMEREAFDPAILKYTITSVKRSIELTRRMAELETLIFKNRDRKEFELKALISEIAAEYPLSTRVQGDCRIVADDALSSVFDNLISNAVIHGRASSLDVRISSDNGRCIVDISDNGRGIPDNVRCLLFHEDLSWGEEKGFGLGLYIVSKILERYGGTIEPGESRGTGARFILEFPLSEGK
ncbi:MAG: PAS domain S-box protein [Candidatus Thermoplasmatota archaeon]|nr:PAS domain S-box protein [Candidatus Thermoplasmatota archaeon]